MKKILVSFGLILVSLFLVACQKNSEVDVDTLLSNLSITFAEGDSLNSVSQDFQLPSLPKPLDLTPVVWHTNSDTWITIQDQTAIVNRPTDENQTVILTISFSYQDKSYEKNFMLNLIADITEEVLHSINLMVDFNLWQTLSYPEGSHITDLPVPTLSGYLFDGWYGDPDFESPWVGQALNSDVNLYAHFTTEVLQDTTSPTLYGLSDILYFIGDDLPDLLENIYALDDVSTSITILVDDSDVDYETPGVYNITYTATDEASNETIESIQITVMDYQVNSSFTETFDTIGTASSSYTSASFTGVNGLVWSYINSRNDELTIDGRSITFGKDATAQIEVSFDGGISGFSFETKNAYTGDADREISVFINDDLVASFLSQNDITLFETSNLTYTGEVTFRIENTHGQRVTIDNITIYQGVDEVQTRLNSVSNNLSIVTHYMENGTLQLPDVSNEVDIEWVFTNLSDSNNTLINLVTGSVTVPTQNYVEVSIDAILSYQGSELIKTFTLKLGEITLSVLEAKQTAGVVKTSGYVTGKIDEGTTYLVFIEDQTAAMVLHVAKTYSFNVGDIITVKGTMNNQVMNAVTQLDKSGTHSVNPLSVTSSLASLENKLVSITGLVSTDYTTGNLLVVNSTGSFQLVDKTNSSLFLDLILGQEIHAYAHVVKVSNQYQLWVSDGASYSDLPVDYSAVVDLILELLNLDLSEVNSDVYLPLTDPYFNSSITWQSSNTTYLTNLGVFSSPDTDTNISLTYQISIKGSIRFTDTLTVLLKAKSALTGYYQNASGLSGTSLLSALTTIISANYHSISYTATNAVLEVADKFPGGSGYLGIYDHIQITAYNKEHVWPQSSFNEALPYRSDMHHLRISDSSTNSARSNYFFNTATITTSTWWKATNRFYPGDQDRGDIARMLLYMAVRYRNDGFRLIVADSGNTSSATAKTMGNLAVLLSWHLADPVDDFERNRNNVIYGTQSNRNPFIDHPELFEEIWQIFMNENGYNNSPRINKYMPNLNVELEDVKISIQSELFIDFSRNEWTLVA